MAKKYDQIVVRKTNGLTIVCLNPTTIYVKHQYGVSVYERWLVRQRNFYSNNWKPFRKALMATKNISWSYINSLAEIYDISVSSVKEIPSLTGAKVREVPEYGRIRK